MAGSIPLAYRFTGRRWDGVIRLYDDNARHYDPAIGRFIQPDSIVPEPVDPQDLNRYTYVRNNPVRYTDPSGHYEFEDTPYDPYWVPSYTHSQPVRRQTKEPPVIEPILQVLSDDPVGHWVVRTILQGEVRVIGYPDVGPFKGVAAVWGNLDNLILVPRGWLRSTNAMLTHIDVFLHEFVHVMQNQRTYPTSPVNQDLIREVEAYAITEMYALNQGRGQLERLESLVLDINEAQERVRSRAFFYRWMDKETHPGTFRRRLKLLGAPKGVLDLLDQYVGFFGPPQFWRMIR